MVLVTIQHGCWKIDQKFMKERRNLTSGWIFGGYFEILVSSAHVTPLHLWSILKGRVSNSNILVMFALSIGGVLVIWSSMCARARMCMCVCVQWDIYLLTKLFNSSSFVFTFVFFLLLPCIYYHKVVLRSRVLQFSFSFHSLQCPIL